MAEEIIKQLREEQTNGAVKKKNKAAQKNKGTKSGQSQKGKDRITEEKVWRFFEAISKIGKKEVHKNGKYEYKSCK